jgi:hypothetical protein
VANVADISEEHVSSVFRTDVSRVCVHTGFGTTDIRGEGGRPVPYPGKLGLCIENGYQTAPFTLTKFTKTHQQVAFTSGHPSKYSLRTVLLNILCCGPSDKENSGGGGG